VMLAAVFVTSGIDKISGFQGLVGAIASKGLPMAEVFAVATIIIEVGVGLLLVAGWKARWAAFVIAVFTVVVTVLFHPFWAVPEAQKAMQQINFFKNVAIVGGLLFVMAFGPGRLSVDKR
ncbi:MAG: DoxX family protein, partial [Burkholderiaceae bacterium]|nr:DoxX family protein [Burkholderiaceae bacterium]